MLGLDTETLRTLTVITLVFSGQALFYVARERQHFRSSLPRRWLIVSSITDLALVSLLAVKGYLMLATPIWLLAGVFMAAIVFAFVLDAVTAAANVNIDGSATGIDERTATRISGAISDSGMASHNA